MWHYFRSIPGIVLFLLSKVSVCVRAGGGGGRGGAWAQPPSLRMTSLFSFPFVHPRTTFPSVHLILLGWTLVFLAVQPPASLLLGDYGCLLLSRQTYFFLSLAFVLFALGRYSFGE
jgi:hypothetical protein